MNTVFKYLRSLGVCLGFVTYACVTLSWVDGYRPTGPGTTEVHSCSPVAGLRVPLAGNAAIIIDAAPRDIYPDPYVQIDLGIRVLLSADAEARLLSPELWLESSEWPQPRKLSVVRVVEWARHTRVLPVDALLHGTEDSATYGYVLAYTTEGPRGRTSIPATAAFRLQLPDILVNGQRVRVDAIQFERYREKCSLFIVIDWRLPESPAGSSLIPCFVVI
ncbi:MAG: hypothetical protein WCH04_09160 [Gammaproteobacteria bacterium]